jgi:hypothetical protein
MRGGTEGVRFVNRLRQLADVQDREDWVNDVHVASEETMSYFAWEKHRIGSC